MKTMKRGLAAAAIVVALVAWASTASADFYYHVTVDLSGYSLTEVEMEFQLLDLNGTIGDSYALVDNVKVFAGGGLADGDDFESGLGNFQDVLNPGYVNAVAGNLDGSGSSLLRLDEDPVLWPTITFADYGPFGSDITELSFDFRFFGNTGGSCPDNDQFVLSLLDPLTLDALVPGILDDPTGDPMDWYGDILNDNAGPTCGLMYTDIVTVETVPAPPLVLLFGTVCIGSAWQGWKRRRKT